MSNVSLRKFKVLIVDQDDAHRWLMHNVLKAMGAGEVMTTASAGEAMSFMKRLTKQPVRTRINSIDFIFADLFMEPMDGISFLRWIRTNAESPNRFLPTILMGASLEPVDIREAKGFGASQLLVKPANIEPLATKVLGLINRPKQFVYTPNYFGPDRRSAKQRAETNRRTMTDLDVRVIRSGLEETLEKMPKDGVIRYFRPPNHLKLKAGLGENGGEGGFTYGAIDNAERELVATKEAVVDQLIDIVDVLQRILQEATDTSDRKEHFERINRLARQMGIQGETFSYSLLTTIGKSLHHFTRTGVPTDETSLELVKAHIDSLTVVLRNRISGDGGAVGQELVSQLQAAIRKIMDRSRRQAVSQG